MVFAPLPSLTVAGVTALLPKVAVSWATFVFARALQQAALSRDELVRLGYLDFTFNGEPSASIWSVIDTHLHAIGNELLGIPVKLRRAPAAYPSRAAVRPRDAVHAIPPALRRDDSN